MIAIDILCVGKLKEKYLKDGIAEYAKRLSRFCSLSLIEVEEEPLASSSAADVEKVRQREGKRLLARADGFVVALCIEGKQLSSPQFSELVADLPNRGVRRICAFLSENSPIPISSCALSYASRYTARL